MFDVYASLSNFIVVSNERAFKFCNCAYALAVVPVLVAILTLGVVTYPVP